MAIQQINLGSAPSGAGGDTQRAANTKINQNFSNSAHAASRLVGTSADRIPLSSQVGEAYGKTMQVFEKRGDVNDAPAGEIAQYSSASTNLPAPTSYVLYTMTQHPNIDAGRKYQVAVEYAGKNIFFRTQTALGWSVWEKHYTTANTTKDTATGFLKASSPVLHVYNDSITKIHEAEQLDITVDKKGTGHYEIHGTTGLRKNDGWFMSPPRDVHGNVLCMIEVTEKDDVVILKTYKKKFDFETVSIVHDWNNPMDIPAGACVEFRFNDLPREQLDEPIE